MENNEAHPSHRALPSRTASFPHDVITGRHQSIQVQQHPFAGRLGGNQDFVITPDTPDAAAILEKTPDARPDVTWSESFDLRRFRDEELWKMALLEGWGTCMQVFLTGCIGIGVFPLVNLLVTGPLVPAIVGGFTNFLAISLFIYAGGAVSGAHFNPLITMATFATRLCTFPRAILYVCFQLLGAVVGGFVLRAGLGRKPWPVPGCFMDSTIVSSGSAFAFEALASMSLLFLAFGTGLDPRQARVYGLAYAPALVGVELGLATFATGIVREGYSGAAINPARCFGFMAASDFQTYHWVHWAGAFVAIAVVKLAYFLVPPYIYTATSATQAR